MRWLVSTLTLVTMATAAHARLFLPTMKLFELQAKKSLDTKIEEYYRSGAFPTAGRSLKDKVQEAEAFLAREAKHSNTVGFATSIVYNDQVVVSNGYGLRDVSDSSLKVQKDTMFQIGSVSKSMIATAIGLLVEDGKVNWEDTVKTHLPWLKLFDKYAEEHVTIGNLLSMNSGFGRSPDLSLFVGEYPTEKATVEALESMEPDSSLRQTPAYGNINFQILGVLIEQVSGLPWHQFLHERVWEPLGMKNTFASAKSVPEDLRRKQLSQGHLQCDGEVLGPFDLVNSTVTDMTPGMAMDYIAAGSIVSSAEDMATMLRFFLNKGKVGNVTLFKSPSTVVEMISGKNKAAFGVSPWTGLRFQPEGSTLAAGYGFDFIGNLAWDRPYVDKGGDTVVHHTAFNFFPLDQIGIVMLSNSQGDAHLVNQFGAYLAGIFLDIPTKILEAQLKAWRANIPVRDPPFPGVPPCGFLFWKNPSMIPLTPEEDDAFIGTYVATASSKFLPTVEVSHSPTAGHYTVRMGGLIATNVIQSGTLGPLRVFTNSDISLVLDAFTANKTENGFTLQVGNTEFYKVNTTVAA